MMKLEELELEELELEQLELEQLELEQLELELEVPQSRSIANTTTSTLPSSSLIRQADSPSR